ncbi:MAG: carbohydrate kinase, partial [Rhodobiaceae bacterium]|nr:carbohydrate kinase [Rhodobiaceae bacterium]
MIVCCGEALIDMLPREIPGEGNGFLPAAGGAVFNTAVALGRLGVPVRFFSGLSDDMFGDILVEALKTSRVDASLSPRSPHPTTLAFVRIVDGNAQYAFFDENSALRLLTEDQLPVLGDNVSTLVFGAISLIPEPCGSTYEALMRREHARRTIYL